MSVNSYTINVLWSDGKVRTIDFGDFLSEYFTKEKSLYYKILQQETFPQAKTDGRTIYWENVATMLDDNGNIISAPLDFCPDVLLKQSFISE